MAVPHVKINIFQQFKYQNNHAISVIRLVFEILKNIDFSLGENRILQDFPEVIIHV